MNCEAGVEFQLTLLFVFSAELRDGRDGLGAVHSHSAAGEFIPYCVIKTFTHLSIHQPEASEDQKMNLSVPEM